MAVVLKGAMGPALCTGCKHGFGADELRFAWVPKFQHCLIHEQRRADAVASQVCSACRCACAEAFQPASACSHVDCSEIIFPY
eukprot:861693-Pleurochrysis_carterae.AAC.2